MRLQSVALLAAALTGACAHSVELVPAPGASALPAPEVGAIARDAGVQLQARTQAWTGQPANLAQNLTPILVEVTNSGARPLAIRYRDFMLQLSDSSKTWAALPPFSIDKTVAIQRPMWRSDGFAVAPYLGAYYPTWRRFEGFPDYDRAYWDRYFPTMRTMQLPTPDMLAAALPEGVLQPGGSMTGFLYFEHVPAQPASVLLRQRLETPDGQVFGGITIPFQER